MHSLDLSGVRSSAVYSFSGSSQGQIIDLTSDSPSAVIDFLWRLYVVPLYPPSLVCSAMAAPIEAHKHRTEPMISTGYLSTKFCGGFSIPKRMSFPSSSVIAIEQTFKCPICKRFKSIADLFTLIRVYQLFAPLEKPQYATDPVEFAPLIFL